MTKMTMMLSLAAAATLAVATPAMAGHRLTVTAPRAVDPDAISVRLSIADLDLASPAGADRLRHRVSSAVSQVCPENAFDRFALATCRTVAATSAAPQVEAAIQRATEIATTGHSLIAAAAIVLSGPSH